MSADAEAAESATPAADIAPWPAAGAVLEADVRPKLKTIYDRS
jgi:hypothetical protein